MIDSPLRPGEFAKIIKFGQFLFEFDDNLINKPSIFFSSYHSKSVLAATTIAIQNSNRSYVSDSILKLHVIKVLEYISRNVYYGKMKFKGEDYSQLFGIPEILLKIKPEVRKLLDEIVSNTDQINHMAFIMEYDYLYLLRKYMIMNGMLKERKHTITSVTPIKALGNDTQSTKSGHSGYSGHSGNSYNSIYSNKSQLGESKLGGSQLGWKNNKNNKTKKNKQIKRYTNKLAKSNVIKNKKYTRIGKNKNQKSKHKNNK
jgi:hypothetical protein